MFPTGARPYGLRHQVMLPPAFTGPIPGITYDPALQQNVTVGNGLPLADQPALLRSYSVTWGTTNRDNKTDDGG